MAVKKIPIIITMVIIGMVGIFYILGQQTDLAGSDPIASVGNSERIDSDNDGLSDWEEGLWGTDPNNPDTDNDGTSDGEEINLGRNPTSADISDKLFDSGTFKTPSLTEEEVLRLKEEFYTNFLKERGEEIREETLLDLVDSFDAEQFTPQYSIQDLNIISGATKNEIRLYGNNLGSIFSRYGSGGIDEVSIFSQGIQNKDSQVLSKLALVSIAYKDLANELLYMPVPLNVSEYHLAMVNGYDVFSRALDAMSAFFADPLQGGGGYQAYLGQTLIIQIAFMNISSYIDSMGIVYSEDEPGYVFTAAMGGGDNSPSVINTENTNNSL